MNFGFDIEPVPGGDGDCATLYTYRIGGDTQPAFDDFMNTPEITGAPDFNRLLVRLARIRDEIGLYDRRIDHYPERWLRDEGDHASALWAPIPVEVRSQYPNPPPSLRLYCFRLDNHLHLDYDGNEQRRAPIIVLGNGGIKETRQPCDKQASRVCQAFRSIKYVRAQFDRGFDEKSIQIVEGGFELEGDLHFIPAY